MRNLLFVSALVLLGCGSSSSTSSETASSDTTTTGSETTSEQASRPAWDDMTPEQRGRFMAEVVVPQMRPVFQGHDATRYAEFGCATCHGANAHDVGFRMPNGL